jgi:hypothetical protein
MILNDFHNIQYELWHRKLAGNDLAFGIASGETIPAKTILFLTQGMKVKKRSFFGDLSLVLWPRELALPAIQSRT